MSLAGGHLDALLAAGATAEQIVALVKADMAEREKSDEKRRAKDRERQQRKRHAESRGVTRTNADSRDPSPKENILTPTR
jgi:ribosomal protein L19E